MRNFTVVKTTIKTVLQSRVVTHIYVSLWEPPKSTIKIYNKVDTLLDALIKNDACKYNLGQYIHELINCLGTLKFWLGTASLRWI